MTKDVQVCCNRDKETDKQWNTCKGGCRRVNTKPGNHSLSIRGVHRRTRNQYRIQVADRDAL